MAIQPTHIDISQEIQAWRMAVYGRDVRAANTSALTKLQGQMNGAVDYINDKGIAIDATVTDVQEVRQAAQDAVDHADQISANNKQYVDGTVAEYKQYADGKLADTEAQRQAAEAAKEGADSAAVLSRSWATGGTGTREGEDGDNSRYYSELSKGQAERATTEAERAAQYAHIVAPGFYVDLGTMTLYQKAGVGVDFQVADGNVLCWKVS